MNKRFAKSFRPRVGNLKPNEPCNIRHHYRGAMREVIGILDLWASNDPEERFVWCGVDAIVEHCKRLSKKPFRKRQVEYALAEFRARYIISKKVVRIRDGKEVEGFIVAPHVSLAVRKSETVCLLTGQFHASGKWQRDIKLVDNAGKILAPPEIGPVFWSAVRSAVESADQSAVRSADQNFQSADQSADAHSAQEDEPKKVNPENGALTVGTSSLTVEAGVTVLSGVAGLSNTGPGDESCTQESGGEEQQQKQGGGVSFSSLSFEGEQSKTVSQHLEGWLVFGSLEEVSGERLKTKTSEWREFGDDNQHLLLTICNQVLAEIRNEPWNGDLTLGRIMDEAATRFITKHGFVPKSWLKVRTELNPDIRKPKR